MHPWHTFCARAWRDASEYETIAGGGARLGRGGLQLIEGERVVEQRLAAFVQLVVHLLVGLPGHAAAECHEVLRLRGLGGILVDEALVHAHQSVHHAGVGLVGLVGVVRGSHEIALREILGEERAADAAQLLLRNARLAVVEEGAEEQLHVKISAHALHIGCNSLQILGAEALEGALRVVDALEHRQEPHPHVVPEDDLHHVRLLEVAPRVRRGALVRGLHQEGALRAVTGAHAHAAALAEDAVGEKAAKRHVRGQVAVRVHHELRLRLGIEGARRGRVQEPVHDGAALAALLTSLVQAALHEEGILLRPSVFQVQDRDVVELVLLDDILRELLAVVRAAVVHGDDLPRLPLLAVEKPLELLDFVRHEVLAVLMLGLRAQAVLLAVHREDAAQVVGAGLLKEELRLRGADRREEHGRRGVLRIAAVGQLLDLLDVDARGQDL
mmetsp:Transcript_41290/g.119583  ORF Transcript_41290/g.119583 Transcript_41290/m.119583 type:complete len:442 (-) Transcript_41290:243-1568(-)